MGRWAEVVRHEVYIPPGVWVPVASQGVPTTPAIAPTVPGSLDYSPTTSSLTLTWTASTPGSGDGIDHYEVSINGTSTVTSGALGVTLTGLPAGTAFSLRVRAVSDKGLVSDWSAELVATTLALAGFPPLYGFWSKPLGSETLAQAYARTVGELGTPKVFRYYYGNDALTWPVQGSMFNGISLFTSHKPYAAGWTVDQVIAGNYDATLDAWARKLPTTYPTYVCAMDHENNVKVTSGTYTLAKGAAAWNRCAGVLRAVGNSMIRICINFSEFTGTNGRGQFAPWAAAIDQDLLDVCTFDQYQNSDGLTVAKGRARAEPGITEALARFPGKKIGIGEVGIVSTYGTDAQKADWSTGMTQVYAEYGQYMEPMAYFNGTGSLGDHILDDYPLTAAVWRAAAAAAN